MSYFKKFPVISGYELDGKTFNVMDITRRTGFSVSTKNNPTLYIEHVIEDGESPIILADRMYDNSTLYWVIMLFNNIYDIESDWPLDQISFDRYINRIYNDPYEIKYYKSMSTDLVVDSDWDEYDRISIRHIDYELEINDKKRYIKIPVPDAVDALVKEHDRLIQQ